MTTSPAQPTEPQAEAGTLADRVASATLAVPGVSGLHAGSFGEVGTYLVGRQVRGVRLRPEGAEVHVTVAMGRPLLEVAEGVRSAVAPLVDTDVTVVVEDVTPAAAPGAEQV